MSSKRTRLIVPPGAWPADPRQVESLRSVFDVVEVQSLDEARTIADGAWLLPPPVPSSPGAGRPAGGEVVDILECLGDAVGVVDAAGRLVWSNARLREHDEETREALVEVCRNALEHFNESGDTAMATISPGRTFEFGIGDTHYEVTVSVAAISEDGQRSVTAVLGTLWEVTASRELQSKIDAIDAAGSELIRIDARSISKMNMAERLQLLEDRIIRAVCDVLRFEDFEIRLINRETKQLELVISRGLTPLRIGEVIFAEAEDNGISGYVAATGISYICNDVAREPRYREGLVNAASTLTVPLRLHDQVVGVLNIEAKRTNAFDENDRRFAEIFGRYVALAMHILDLLVVERFTTNEQLSEVVLGELNGPLGEITDRATGLREHAVDPSVREGLDWIIAAAGSIRSRVEACTLGPKSLIGADLAKIESDPIMVGKRVIIADNEPIVRRAITVLLTRKGCEVIECSGGGETIDLLHAEAGRGFPDLIISDIRMPDRNGYEVFRAAKELCADTPVILMTGFGYDPHHSIVRASQEGLHSFLFKPLHADQLLEAIARAFSAV